MTPVPTSDEPLCLFYGCDFLVSFSSLHAWYVTLISYVEACDIGDILHITYFFTEMDFFVKCM